MINPMLEEDGSPINQGFGALFGSASVPQSGEDGLIPVLARQLETLSGEISATRSKRAKLINDLNQRIAARGALRMQRVMPQQQDPRDMALAGAVALAGQLAGARNANQAFGNFAQTSQGLLNQRNQVAMQNAEIDFANRDRAAQMGIQGGQALVSGVDEDLQDLLRQYNTTATNATNLFEATERTQQERIRQEALSGRATEANQTRMSVAQMQDETRRFGIEAQTKSRDNAQFNEMMGTYNALRQIGHSDADARKMVGARFNLQLAQIENTRERTRLMPAQLELRRREIDQRGDLARQRMSVDLTRLNAQGLRDVEDSIRLDLAETESSIRALRNNRARLQATLAEAMEDTAPVIQQQITQIDAEIKTLQQEQIQMRNRLKEMRDRLTVPGMPVDPFQADPSLRGRIGGR